jgi:NAD-dependent SIR2 family protein deacetylase
MSTHPLNVFLAEHRRLFVLTGAGCSTESGIPDYRDAQGSWKHAPPVTYAAFMGSEAIRKRYWARSLAGWPRVHAAKPNAAHLRLAELERIGRIELLLTQNVDGLHQRAGSQQVLDLHGRIDRVRCMGCARLSPRAALQQQLERLNPGWSDVTGRSAPDGDADLEGLSFEQFVVPPCPHCGAILKPDVVFFGESVPRERVEEALRRLKRAEAMLVVGSSLMIYSGYRFVQAAVGLKLPIAAINLGRTRADPLLSLKVSAPCGEVLGGL